MKCECGREINAREIIREATQKAARSPRPNAKGVKRPGNGAKPKPHACPHCDHIAIGRVAWKKHIAQIHPKGKS